MNQSDTLPLSTELRAKTAKVHEALDSGMIHAFGRLDQYVAFLRASHRVLSSLDDAMNRFCQRPTAEQSTLVAADLLALGQPIHPTPNAPAARPLWSPSDYAEAIGCAYVIEGSRLGGLVIAKIVERQLGISATTYLHGHGARTKDLWRAFLSELDAWGERARPEERNAAVHGAHTTFSTYIRCFADEGLVPAELVA